MRRTSGRARASHHSTLSRRAFSELTFQVAIRTAPRLPRAGPPWLVLRAARLPPPGAEGPDRGTATAAPLRPHGREPVVERDLELLRRLLPVVEAREGDAGQAASDRALDARNVALLLGRHEEECIARRLGPGRPSHAMDVVLGAVGHVEVDDVRQLLDVDAAGGDVGGDEDRDLPRLEAGEGLGPLRLAAVAVD